jgi:CIC family chloride channel protein
MVMIHDRRNTPRTTLQQLIRFIRRSDTAFLLIFAVLTGVGAGYGAVVFRWLIHLLTHVFFDGGKTAFSFFGRYYVVIIPAIGGLIVGFITHYLAPETRGHGVPEVMLAIDKQGGKIRFRVALIKAIVSSICIGSGGSVGREGPIVQIGSSLGSSMGQLFNLPKEKIRILVACGAGGGIAATFNAPLAGIFFALEVIMRDYSPRHISSIVLSSVIATVVSRNYLGNNPAFDIPVYQMNSAWEILFYMAFGLLAAGAGFLFIRLLYRTEDLFNILPVPKYIYPAIGGLMVGVIGLWYPQIFGVGYETIELTLYGKVTTVLALALLFAKLAATSLTLGSGGSGGVFAPSLFIGAMLGVAFSKLTLILFPNAGIEPGASALIGMAAVFAAAAHAPISAILFLFELTGDYKIILPLMAAVIIAYLVMRGLSPESIYTLKLVRRGHDIKSRRRSDLLEYIIVDEAMSRNVITVSDDQLVEKAGLMIKNTRHRGFPVVEQNNRLCGIITHKDINKAMAKGLGKHPVKEVMTKDVITCTPDENLRQALEKLGTRNIGRSPVVDPKYPGTIVGIITRKNIISAIHDYMKEGL